MKTATMQTKQQSYNRRSFIKGGAAVGAVAAGSLAAPALHAQKSLTIKMQSSWPASDVFQEMAKQFVERIEAMSGGRIKIELMPAGAVVAAFKCWTRFKTGLTSPIPSRSIGTERTRQPPLRHRAGIWRQRKHHARLVLQRRRPGTLS